MENKPDCYKCVHRLTVPGSCHSRCNNKNAIVVGNQHGINRGWFYWPINFDPVWLQQCNGFSDKPEDKKERVEYNPLLELLSILR